MKISGRRTHSNAVRLRGIGKRVVPIQGFFGDPQGGADGRALLARWCDRVGEKRVNMIHSRNHRREVRGCTRKITRSILEDLSSVSHALALNTKL